MSFIDGIMDFFTPKDGLYRQAEQLISQYDTNGDGKLDLNAMQATGGGAYLFGVPGRSFVIADMEGNGNGVLTKRELRSHMKQFDVGNIFNPYGANDKQLDGFEMARMYASDMLGGIFGRSNNNRGGYAFGGGAQAVSGVSSIR